MDLIIDPGFPSETNHRKDGGIELAEVSDQEFPNGIALSTTLFLLGDESLGSDAALKSRDNLCFFEDVGVEGFFAF
jgi:hypothetical protein